MELMVLWEEYILDDKLVVLDNNGVPVLDDCKGCPGRGTCYRGSCTDIGINRAIVKLKEYEDTGLSPKGLMKAKNLAISFLDKMYEKNMDSINECILNNQDVLDIIDENQEILDLKQKFLFGDGYVSQS